MDKLLELLFRKESLGPASTLIVAALLGGWLTFRVDSIYDDIDGRLLKIEGALVDQWSSYDMSLWSYQLEKELRKEIGSNFEAPDPRPIKFRGMSLESLLLDAPYLNKVETIEYKLNSERIWKPLKTQMMAQQAPFTKH